jgi:hypothetical protein
MEREAFRENCADDCARQDHGRKIVKSRTTSAAG